MYCLHPFLLSRLALTLLLISSFCVCLSAALLHQAGTSSFSTSEESSFWSSDAGNFTFGFQPVNGGDDYLPSIWHSRDPNKTAIWWIASAPPLKAGATLLYSRSGSLELYNASTSSALLWSSNTSSFYSTLEDTGDLVLLESNNLTHMAWQSLDDSRDSLMLAGGVDVSRVSNKPSLLQSRSRNQPSYAAGDFRLATDGDLHVYCHALDSLGNDFVYLYADMNVSGGFYIGRPDGNQYTANADSLNETKRLTLDYDGNLRVYMWDSNVSAWSAVWQILDDKCMLGSPCGPFGLCTPTQDDGNSISCSCPPGYQPRNNDDMSQGCQASVSFNASCGTGSDASNFTAEIVEVPNSDYSYNDLTNQPNLDMEQCKQLCLNNCACMAASYTSDNTCFIKGNSSTGYLLNGYASDSNTLLIKVATKNVPSDIQNQVQKWAVGVGIAVPLAVLLTAGLSAWLLYRRRNRGKGTASLLPCWRRRERGKHLCEAAGEFGPLKFYRYEELLEATRNFNDKIGEGGFGIVYKGWVKPSQSRNFQQSEQLALSRNNHTSEVAVAVKVFKIKSHESGGASAEAQFRAEVSTLGNIHHVNLVRLLGYCFKRRRTRAGEKRMLVYEYMENGSLDKYLRARSLKQLAWSVRFSIALGAARGIAYLHHECNPPILHCDIKPHNILLNTHFMPKVADFGSARCFNVDSHITMSGIHGTRGYLAPEWLKAEEQITAKVDVFSFGMLLLELVRGFKVVDENTVPLVRWARQCIAMGKVLVPELDMSELRDTTSVVEQEAVEKLRILKVGMWCIQPNPSMRPTMLRVVQLIEGTLAVDDPPIIHSMSDEVSSSLSSGHSDSRPSSPASTFSSSYFSVVSAR